MFAKAGHTSSGRQRYRAECLECKSSRDKKYRDFPERRAISSARANSLKKIRKDYVIRYLKENPCVDCSVTDFRVLEFDHVRGEKHLSISQMVGSHYSMSSIKLEIEKCDVRCANCHRIKTAERANWTTLDYN